MEIFYFDQTLESYEKLYQWDKALNYLEDKYVQQKGIQILCSLIGFSWFYLIEGPVVSREYQNDSNSNALYIWKKYLDVGAVEAGDDPYFNFIAGYTLSLHGFYINEEYERKGSGFINKCMHLTDNTFLYQLAENFAKNEHSRKYIPLKNGRAICERLFYGGSLLDEYFNELYFS